VRLTISSTCAQLTGAADTDEADNFYGDNRQDLKRKVQYARGSDPDFLSEPRPYRKVRLRPSRQSLPRSSHATAHRSCRLQALYPPA
jgi:hypothetical protein